MIHLLNIIYTFIHLGPYAIIRYYPFRDKLRIPIKALVALYVILISIEALLFAYLSAQQFWNATYSQIFRMSFVLFFAVLSFCLIKENFFKQLYMWLLAFAIGGLFHTNANYIEARFFYDMAIEYPHLIVIIITLLQIILTFPYLIRFIDIRIRPVIQEIDGKIWKLIWPVPVFLYGSAFIETWSLELHKVATPFYLTVRFSAFINTIFYSLVIAEALKKASENSKLKENILMTDRQLNLERDNFKMLEAHIEEVRRNKHDLRHHISVFQSFVENGEYEKLAEYLEQFELTMPDDTPVYFCSNSALNAIASYYYQEAVSKHINIDVQMKLPEQTRILDTDLCVVLGNLFENAIEACNKQNNSEKFIKVTVAMAGNKVVITVDNSFEQDVLSQDGYFLSSKRLGRGIGTTSVQAIAEKYKGFTKFEHDEKIFSASVMLQSEK